MSHSSRWRPTPALVVALLALVVAIGGTAFAASNVGTKDIKREAVTKPKIAKRAVSGNRLAKDSVKSGKIRDAAVKGSKVKDDSIDSSKLSDVDVFGDSFVKVTATNGANEAAARAAAPEMTLFAKGPLSVTARCFRDTGGDQTYGEIYGATTQAGSILDGQDDLDGGAANEYLNPGTAPVERQLQERNTAAGNDASYNEDEYALGAPDGTSLIGETAIAVKNGTLAGGQGPYGDGNVCLFQGDAHG